MIFDPFASQGLSLPSNLGSPFCGQKSVFRFQSRIVPHEILDEETHHVGAEFHNTLHANDFANDYVVGEGDTRHAVMVEQFLRLLCEETPKQAADAVVLVDIPGRVRGYGYRRGSSLAGLLARLSDGSITDVLAENMQRRWLNRNIECIALQQQHWRIFRLYASESTYTVLMDFHPVEMQRTALVLWVLQKSSSHRL
jgi:hypothetical protein